MHYKNGREAKVGDLVIGITYNRPTVQIGRVLDIRTSQNPEEVKTCNVKLMLPTVTFVEPDTEYTQCDWLLHVEDVWNFVISLAFTPGPLDYFARVQNFASKWNSPMKEKQYDDGFTGKQS